AGMVWVNKHLDPGLDTPFAGAKQSGLGVEMGQEGLEEFTQATIINMARESIEIPGNRQIRSKTTTRSTSKESMRWKPTQHWRACGISTWLWSSKPRMLTKQSRQ